jgi:GNAT superfamily N-acetyltransferase
MPDADVVCWEALEPKSPDMLRARQLYEAHLDEAERIPWVWIEEAVKRRPKWHPGRWSAHLLLSAMLRKSGSTGSVTGFVYGIHLPGYGGYACYLAVDPRYRGQGTGTRLLNVLTQVLRVDAACEGAPLPFVVLESHAPDAEASAEEHASWQARLRLFNRVGAKRITGITFMAPNFDRRSGPSVPLQLFLIPVDQVAEAFDEASLRSVAAGLMENVYGRSEKDPLYRQTLPPGNRPSLENPAIS